jgi:hypothetical protein
MEPTVDITLLYLVIGLMGYLQGYSILKIYSRPRSSLFKCNLNEGIYSTTENETPMMDGRILLARRKIPRGEKRGSTEEDDHSSLYVDVQHTYTRRNLSCTHFLNQLYISCLQYSPFSMQAYKIGD